MPPPRAGMGVDGILYSLGGVVPGFTGISLGRDGELVVSVVGGRLTKAEIQRLLAAMRQARLASRMSDVEIGDVRAVESHYPFRELAVARERLIPAAGWEGIWMVDIDEVHGVIRITADEAAAGRIREAMEDLGIEDDMVEVRVGEPVRTGDEVVPPPTTTPSS